MQYRQLGKTGLRVSELSLGTLPFGAQTDEKTSREIIHRALAAGINCLDTADIYPVYTRGTSEEILGRAIKGRRDQLVISTKVRLRMGPGPNDEGLSRAHIMPAVEGSLRRLGTDYIDLYQAHYPDPSTPLEETLSAFNDLVRQGKVRYIGCSNFPAWLICQGLWISDRRGWEPFTFVQPPYNLLDRSAERELLPFCQQLGLGVIVWGPLAGGGLTGKYRRGQPPPPESRGEKHRQMGPVWDSERDLEKVEKLEALAKELGKTAAQLALAWVLAHQVVSSAIVGATSVAQLEQNLGATGWTLSAEELSRINEITPAV